jgi:hypothetical protein
MRWSSWGDAQKFNERLDAVERIVAAISENVNQAGIR